MNVFEFGNTYWLQKDGTAMGTPCACNYATIVFAYYKRTCILPRFKKNSLLYLRYIDDIFVVWRDFPSQPDTFTDFKRTLDNQCNLKWTTEERNNKTNFLDLTIELDTKNSTFTTRTYQKASNLFLYIPAKSAHPPGLLKGLICGFLETYWYQNTNKKDYIKMVSLLYTRLLNRGYESSDLAPIFNQAALQIDNKLYHPKTKKKLNPPESGRRIFFHLEYHKRDISRKFIRDSYERSCELPNEDGHSFNNPTTSGINISRVTIAYSRSKNLRDKLVPSTLFETDSCNAASILKDMKTMKQLNGQTL